MRTSSATRITAAAMLVAICAGFSLFFRLPLSDMWYLHPGISILMLSGFLLGGAMTAAVGAVSALIIALLSGMPNVLLVDMIAQTVMGGYAGAVLAKARRAGAITAACFSSGLVLLLAYFVIEWPLFGWSFAFASCAPHAVQVLGNSVLGALFVLAASKLPALPPRLEEDHK